MARKPKRPELTHARVTFTTHPKAPWRVTYDGKRVRLRKSYADEERAWEFAIRQDHEIGNHGVRYGNIPPEVRRAFDYYRDESAALRNLGAEVPRFEDLVSGALGGIRDALHAAAAAEMPVAEAVEEFVAYKSSRVKARQLADITNRLKRFARDYGDRSLPAITTPTVEKWLAGLRKARAAGGERAAPLSPLSRNHYRAILHAFFTYCSRPARGYCLSNPVAHLEPEQVRSGKPKAYAPEDVRKVLECTLEQSPELLPRLALGFFAGLRTSEAEAFDIGKLTPETEEFRVDSNKTDSRIVPLLPACKAWLFAQPRREGQARQRSERMDYIELAVLFKAAGVGQLHNGARHSFISYRCAEIRDVAQVADEVGNSPGTIKKHYREIVTGAEAAKFFAIRPPVVEANVTRIEEGRASA